jgi:hypothetical protein
MSSRTEKVDGEICNECGCSVAWGSGHFVNRVPDLNDADTRREMGRPFPNGGYVCADCEERIGMEANDECGN